MNCDELWECHKCGSYDIKLIREHKMYIAICPDCETKGQHMFTKKEAIVEWNKLTFKRGDVI